MKTKQLLLAALALICALASCTPDPAEEPIKEDPKSDECRLTSLVINVGDETINTFVNVSDKTIEVRYFEYQLPLLKSATAVATISDKATISPDPSVAMDYTVEGGIEFTVTAEDGVSTTKYTTYLAVARIAEKCSLVWEKTYGELGLTGKPNFDCGIAFCDKNKFVYADLRVFDLQGNYVGQLCVDGMPEPCIFTTIADPDDPEGKKTIEIIAARNQLASLSNDVNGVLVASAWYEGPHDEGKLGSCNAAVYAWVDGWDKAPTLIYGPEQVQYNYMSVAGDVKGDFVMNFRSLVTSAVEQQHNVLVYKGGKYFNADGSPAYKWYPVVIPHPCNDGCWGQILSFFSGDPENGFVCWDSLAAAEYGESGNASSAFYVYDDGLTAFLAGDAEEVPLYGQVHSVWGPEGRRFDYGNYSIGHVRAFIYNGQKYIIASHSSWPNNWITVQRANNIVEDNPATENKDESSVNYLLGTSMIEDTGSCAPCSAYLYDPLTRTGHIIYASQNRKVVAYDITTTIL